MDRKVTINSTDLPINMYEKIDVIVHGIRMSARPIDFLYDNEKNPVRAIKYETVDPNTGQLLMFDIDEVEFRNGVACIGDESETVSYSNSCTIAYKQKRREKVVVQRSPCPFVDPIELKTYSI